jgi:hypothetical protein
MTLLFILHYQTLTLHFIYIAINLHISKQYITMTLHYNTLHIK